MTELIKKGLDLSTLIAGWAHQYFGQMITYQMQMRVDLQKTALRAFFLIDNLGMRTIVVSFGHTLHFHTKCPKLGLTRAVALSDVTPALLIFFPKGSKTMSIRSGDVSDVSIRRRG